MPDTLHPWNEACHLVANLWTTVLVPSHFGQVTTGHIQQYLQGIRLQLLDWLIGYQLSSSINSHQGNMISWSVKFRLFCAWFGTHILQGYFTGSAVLITDWNIFVLQISKPTLFFYIPRTYSRNHFGQLCDQILVSSCNTFPHLHGSPNTGRHSCLVQKNLPRSRASVLGMSINIPIMLLLYIANGNHMLWASHSAPPNVFWTQILLLSFSWAPTSPLGTLVGQYKGGTDSAVPL